LLEGGDDTGEGFAGEVLHRENLGTGETRLAEDRRAQLEHLLWRGWAAAAAESLDAAENGGRGLSGDGLIRDGFEEGFVRGARRFEHQLERSSLFDETLETFVALGEELHGLGKVEGRRWRGHARGSRAVDNTTAGRG